MKNVKQVVRKTALAFTNDFPGLKGVNIMERTYPIEPFLVLTEFRMDRPVFGPHPHAGISVMTYMLPDSPTGFINRDSNGDHSIIEPGGLHITQAGSGIHHDEFPQEKGIAAHGFQIWINHADEHRLVPPLAMHAAAKEVPEVRENGCRVRVVHGSYGGEKTMYQMKTPVTLLHIFLEAGQPITLPAEEMAFLYAIQGTGETADTPFFAQNLLNFETNGDTVSISAGENGCELLFGTGTPHREPITYGGPFVATTPEQMADLRRRYALGEMGRLAPYEKG